MKKNTKLLDKMMDNLRKMNGLKLRWGFDDEAEYDDPRGVTKVAEVAQLVENGHYNSGLFPNTITPPRPFFKIATTDQENHREIRAEIKRMYAQIVKGNMTPEERMDELGEIVTRQLEESIRNFGGTIADSTKEMREYRDVSSDDPLLESETLVNSVTYTVESV